MILEFVEHAMQTMDVDEDSFDEMASTCEDVLRHAAESDLAS
jgi:hypothetical protein